jgi:hypothetical protein
MQHEKDRDVYGCCIDIKSLLTHEMTSFGFPLERDQ